jgi:hypothetical protein
MELFAKIVEISYKPFLCKKLKTYSNLKEALETDASFILDLDNDNKFAISWWVSAKRTRSYPYARVYNTLDFPGKKVTIIPIYKDEGLDGDRDFLQWDTISLMSLLGVYTIIGYYKEAIKNNNYDDKITSQRYDTSFILPQLKNLKTYRSDALHWNSTQVENVGDIAENALKSYNVISNKTKTKMHSEQSVLKRIEELKKGKENFMNLSHKLAFEAQNRESLTTQPKENVRGNKSKITITNYLGGNYYFTSDEAEFDGKEIRLYECKHSKNAILPSIDDIKDGLIKMFLFSNLDEVMYEGKIYPHKAILKLTSDLKTTKEKLLKEKGDLINTIIKEAKENGFELIIN